MLRSCSMHGIAGDRSPAATTDWGHFSEGREYVDLKVALTVL
jgi:hypothetical protein